MALNLLKKIFGNGNETGSDLLLPAEQFRTLILHECARCDRNAHAFSMIHVDLRDGDHSLNHSGKHDLRHLTRSLVQRMRTTDEIGWLDGHSVGVFLPETGKEGAQSLAQDACQGFAYQIFTYPWLGDVRPGAADGDSRNREQNRRDPEHPQVSAEREDRGAQQLAFHSEGSRAISQAITDDVGNKPGAEKLSPIRNIEELILPDRAPAWKRTYDIIGTSILLVAFSPVLAAVAMYIKIVSPGPVFFRQERMGYLGRPFTMIKFRTMRTGSDNVSVHKDYLKDLICSDDKAMTKLDTGTDNRLIPLAGLLRRSCIDELPQLLNVFKGEMSLVGPRPEQPYYVNLFRESVPRYMERHREKAGMTGWAQVNGMRGDTSIIERTRFDIWYTENWSVLLDIKIIVRTFWQIVSGNKQKPI